MAKINYMNKLIDMYLELRTKTDINYFRDLQVVILMTPKSFNNFAGDNSREFILERNLPEYVFINLCGTKAPIIIDNTLPNNIEIQMITRQEYERIEKEKMMKRIVEMFEWRY